MGCYISRDAEITRLARSLEKFPDKGRVITKDLARLPILEKHKLINDVSDKFVSLAWDAVLVRVLEGDAIMNRKVPGNLRVVVLPGKGDDKNVLDSLVNEERPPNLYEFSSKGGKHPVWNQEALLMYLRTDNEDEARKIRDGIVAPRRIIRVSFEGSKESCEIPIPLCSQKWVHHELKFPEVKVCVQVRSFLAEDKNCSSLQIQQFESNVEKIILFPLTDNQKALLRFYPIPSNICCSNLNGKVKKNALVWIPGRNDSFHTPSFGQMIHDAGYDLYVLEPRRCGACRREFPELVPPELQSHTEDFKESIQEIQMALNYIEAKNYENVIGYVHSTGVLYLIAYIIYSSKKDTQFSGFVMNSPFLDWNTGSEITELFLEQGVTAAAELGALSPTFPVSGGLSDRDLSTYHLRVWKQYGFDNRTQCIAGTSVTAGWVKAVTRIQNELHNMDEPLTMKPFLCITTPQDVVLDASETRDWSKKIGPDRTFISVPFTHHDVISGVSPENSQDAREKIIDWLKKTFNQ